MHWEECGSEFPARCDLGHTQSSCIAVCKTGCFCDDGFVLKKAGGVCIRQEDCPTPIRNGCAGRRCAAGSICKDGKCIRKFICPEYMPAEPKEGCHYVTKIDANGCRSMPQVCPDAQ
uniref:TIL domain-containing protein n=1 Tax=Plectus sambesii TaxID=2011161 RepID=A0A914VW01_9BILA